MILTVSTNTVPIEVSEDVIFIIEPAWPTYPSFRILPSDEFQFEQDAGSAPLTAQNTSPTNMTGTQLVSSITYLSGLVLGVPAITGSTSTSVWEDVITTASGYEWYFNGANVASTRNWEYQFFDPITGTIYN